MELEKTNSANHSKTLEYYGYVYDEFMNELEDNNQIVYEKLQEGIKVKRIMHETSDHIKSLQTKVDQKTKNLREEISNANGKH